MRGTKTGASGFRALSSTPSSSSSPSGIQRSVNHDASDAASEALGADRKSGRESAAAESGMMTLGWRRRSSVAVDKPACSRAMLCSLRFRLSFDLRTIRRPAGPFAGTFADTDGSSSPCSILCLLQPSNHQKLEFSMLGRARCLDYRRILNDLRAVDLAARATANIPATAPLASACSTAAPHRLVLRVGLLLHRRVRREPRAERRAVRRVSCPTAVP